MEIVVRAWFKDPESEESQYMAKAIKALGLRPSNAMSSMHYYDSFVPSVPDAYSENFDHRYVFWMEGKDETKERANLKAFILISKWMGGYVEISIANMDFYHLGVYIGNQGTDSELTWEQSEKLKLAGLKHPLDR
jgi:hypothetical protein